MKAAELLVRCLENEQVRFAFGLPGEENLELMDALRDSAIRFILTRHEGAAAFMADVHGRLTGRAGVCLATLGPGATNLVTGVADAFLDRAPLVAITAQADLSKAHREAHQFIDVLELFDPITKWNARIENARAVPEIVRKAFKTAQADKPGSTHIELPENVADEAVPEGIRPLPWESTRLPSPDRSSVERAASLVDGSNRPLILAGNGVVRGRAADELTKFAEKFHIPVAHTFMAKGAVPWKSPMNLLTLGIQAYDFELAGFGDADLVICVGYDIVEYEPRFWNPRGDQRIVHVDVLPAETSAQYVPEVEIVADIRESLLALRERVAKPKALARPEELRQRIVTRLESHTTPPKAGLLSPKKVLEGLQEAMGSDDLLISDVGAHKIWIGRFFHAMKPNTVLFSNGLSAMGIALPGGIAAKLLDPSRRVVTVSGDGGFLMGVHELETAKRERAPTVNLVFRDGSLGSIRWKQLAKFGRTVGTDFGNPDLRELARAFGIRGRRVDHASDVTSVVAEALDSNEPTLVDIPVDYTENPFAADGP